jgi:hypothetical protein
LRNCFFPTPDTVVQTIIKSEASGNYQCVLEPAVGDGALLRALNKNYRKLVAFDINQENLDKVYTFTNTNKTELFCTDFLSATLDSHYDLILSNPPFNNNLAHHVTYSGKKIPVEAAFVLKCLEHLSLGGKAIFILPPSIITGDKMKWLRSYLATNYKISSIYKLPKFSFNKVEGGFYVLCVQRVRELNYTILLSSETYPNHFINSTQLQNHHYHLDPDHLKRLATYKTHLETLGSVSLSKMGSIMRGNVGATGNRKSVYHSTDFKSHTAPEKPLDGLVNSSATLSKYDIVIKRVCRSASASFSIYTGSAIAPCSDCLIVITPSIKNKNSSVRLLLALRVSVLLGAEANFENSGSGANYISLGRLRELNIPSQLLNIDKKIVEKYSRYIFSGKTQEALEIENSLCKIFSGELSHRDHTENQKCTLAAS